MMVGYLVRFETSNGKTAYVRPDEVAAVVETEGMVVIALRGISDRVAVSGPIDDVVTKLADAMKTIPDLYGPAGTEIRRP